MRVLFLSAWFPVPADNGSKLRVLYLLRGLAKRHEVTLASFAFATADLSATNDLKTICKDVRVVKLNPFTANRAGPLQTFLSLSPVVSRPLFPMTQQIAYLLNQQKFDAVIASTEVMACYALQIPVPVTRILEEHNSMMRWAYERYAEASGLLQRSRRLISWWKQRAYEARMFPKFELITMVSEVDRGATLDVMASSGVPVEVVPNGVDCEHNRPGWVPALPGVVVFNGSLTYNANYDAMKWFLSDVYPRVRAHRRSVTLTITGSTQNVNLRDLPLDESVSFTGYVDDVRVPVSQAMVCVVPIRNGGGTRLKILVAMALGTPIVSTSKGAEGLDVRDGVHLLIADSAAEFARRTLILLDDRELRSRLVANARRLVEDHYNWTTIGSRFASLVEEAADGRKREVA